MDIRFGCTMLYIGLHSTGESAFFAIADFYLSAQSFFRYGVNNFFHGVCALEMVRKIPDSFFQRFQVYCHAGLCRFGQRFSFVEYVVGRSVVKSLVSVFAFVTPPACSYAWSGSACNRSQRRLRFTAIAARPAPVPRSLRFRALRNISEVRNQATGAFCGAKWVYGITKRRLSFYLT